MLRGNERREQPVDNHPAAEKNMKLNNCSTATGGKVRAVKQDLAKILLTQPVCTQEGEKIAGHGHNLAAGEARDGGTRAEGQDVAHCRGFSPETARIRQGARAALNTIARRYPPQTGGVVDFPWPLRIGGHRTDLHVARDLDGRAPGLTMPPDVSSRPRPGDAGGRLDSGRLQDLRCA